LRLRSRTVSTILKKDCSPSSLADYDCSCSSAVFDFERMSLAVSGLTLGVRSCILMKLSILNKLSY
jgi:hypothetical protein